MNTILDPKQNPRVYWLAYGLWFLTSILSIITFLAGRQVIIRSYSRFFPLEAWRLQIGDGALSLLSILISFPLAMMMIAIIIGGFEYQHRNMGKSSAWQFLAYALAIEFGILLLALFI